MRIRKVIKSIGVLGAGATMVGATIFGATAADLANYPKPYVEDNAFNGVMVIGDNAAAEDIVGVTDIAVSLQYSVSGGASSGASATTSTEGEIYKVEKSSNNLNMGDALTDVQTSSIDNEDLPNLLADGSFRNKDGSEFDYEQNIDLDSGLTLDLFSDTEYNDDEPAVGIFADIDDGILNYTLDFNTALETGNASGVLADIEDKKITLLGDEYDITDATVSGGDVKLELMKGSILTTMEEGETKTFTIDDKEYEVNVAIITDTGTQKVKFVVNGETTDALNVDGDDTYKLSDGTTLGVREILPNEAGDVTQDIVEFYLGANKLTLENDKEVIDENDDDIDGVKSYISTGVSSGELTITDIKINWDAYDEVFITEDTEAAIPGLGSIKLLSQGMTYPTKEETTVENNGGEIELSTTIEDGDVTIPLLYSADGIGNWTKIGGEGDSETLVTSAGTTDLVLDRDDDNYAVLTSVSAKESYLLKLDSLDSEDGASFSLHKGDSDWEDQKVGDSFDVGDITVSVTNYSRAGKNATFDLSNGRADRIITKAGMTILMPVNESNINVGANDGASTFDLVFKEDDKTEGTTTTDTTDGAHLNMTLEPTGSSNKETQVGSVNISTSHELQSQNDVYVDYLTSDVASKVLWDKSGDEYTASIEYHGGESYGNIFVGAEASSVTISGGEESSEGDSVTSRIEVGATKLASEVTDPLSKNIIAVGGPCANSAAAAAMGNPDDCTAGFEAGKGVIQMFENDGNVAMVVAGYAAEDTRAASAVVANYDNYDLSGEKVEVTTASKTVTEVSAEEPVVDETEGDDAEGDETEGDDTEGDDTEGDDTEGDDATGGEE